MIRALTMNVRTEFISFPDHQARYLERTELIRHKPTRVIAAKELDDGDLDVWVQGCDRLGSFYGCLRWSDIRRKPRSAAWIQRDDFAIVTNMIWRQRRK